MNNKPRRDRLGLGFDSVLIVLSIVAVVVTINVGGWRLLLFIGIIPLLLAGVLAFSKDVVKTERDKHGNPTAETLPDPQ